MSVSHPYTAMAIEAAKQGLGWEDLCVRYGIGKTHARLIVAVHGGTHGRGAIGKPSSGDAGGSAVEAGEDGAGPLRPAGADIGAAGASQGDGGVSIGTGSKAGTVSVSHGRSGVGD